MLPVSAAVAAAADVQRWTRSRALLLLAVGAAVATAGYDVKHEDGVERHVPSREGSVPSPCREGLCSLRARHAMRPLAATMDATALDVPRGRCPGRGARPCMIWLHIQKTGTAFSETVINAGCPGQPNATLRRWPAACAYALGPGAHTHTPYVPHQHGLGTAVTLLRSPRKRLVSAWFFGKEKQGGVPMLPLGHPEKLFEGTRAARARLAKHMPTVQAYASYPGIAHCQTKMVLGHHCGSLVEVTPAMGWEAVRRVREDFRFVGVQDYWAASVALFRADHNGTGSSVAGAQHRYTRRERDAALANLTDFNDEYDEALYRAALDLLRTRCAARGIPVEANSHESFERGARRPSG